MDVVELLRGMVAVPSPSGGEGPLARWLVERMAELGFASEVDGAGNAVGVLGDGPRLLVLLGHLDTVPGGPPVELREGRLFGRGTVDAKGPLAAFVTAAAAAGAATGWRIAVVGAVEEEAPSSRGARFVAERYRPVACVIGEPSGWDAVTLGYKGRLLVDVERSQPTAHGAGPEPSAAEHVVGFWNAVSARVESFNRDRDRLFHRLQTRLESIRSEREPDREVARATVGFRLPPGLSPDDLLASLPAWQAGDGTGDGVGDGVTARLRAHGAVPTHVSGAGSPLVRAFLHGIRTAGGRPRFKHKTGTSDMNVVGPVWGCPILAYGAGDSRLDHTPREHVEVDELRRSVTVLEAALRRLQEP
jgi:LysW-gamma-L-lysine carboxypeptidase